MSNTQAVLEVRQDGIYTYGIKCEDQEMAWEIIAKQVSSENSGQMKFTVSARQMKEKAAIGSTYSIPNLRWEEVSSVIMSDDEGFNKVTQKVARLILEEQEPSDLENRLLEKQRHRDAIDDEIRFLENEIFYLKNPKCRP